MCFSDVFKHPGEIETEVISFLPSQQKRNIYSLCELCVSSEAGGEKTMTENEIAKIVADAV